MFACVNRIGRCRLSPGFLGGLPFPPPFHFGAPPYSPQSPSSAFKTSMLRAVQTYSLRGSAKGDPGMSIDSLIASTRKALTGVQCCHRSFGEKSINPRWRVGIRLNSGVLRADEGEARRGKLDIPEKTRRPTESSSRIPRVQKSGRDPGVALVERLDCSPPNNANRVQSPARSLPNFRKWESCRTMPLVGRFCRGSPDSPDLTFRRCSILTPFHPHRLSRLLNSTRFWLLCEPKSNPGSIPGRVTPDFCMWESCRKMPLVGGFSRGYSVSPILSFRRCSILTSIILIGSQDLDVQSRPNLFTSPSHNFPGLVAEASRLPIGCSRFTCTHVVYCSVLRKINIAMGLTALFMRRSTSSCRRRETELCVEGASSSCSGLYRVGGASCGNVVGSHCLRAQSRTAGPPDIKGRAGRCVPSIAPPVHDKAPWSKHALRGLDVLKAFGARKQPKIKKSRCETSYDTNYINILLPRTNGLKSGMDPRGNPASKVKKRGSDMGAIRATLTRTPNASLLGVVTFREKISRQLYTLFAVLHNTTRFRNRAPYSGLLVVQQVSSCLLWKFLAFDWLVVSYLSNDCGMASAIAKAPLYGAIIPAKTSELIDGRSRRAGLLHQCTGYPSGTLRPSRWRTWADEAITKPCQQRALQRPVQRCQRHCCGYSIMNSIRRSAPTAVNKDQLKRTLLPTRIVDDCSLALQCYKSIRSEEIWTALNIELLRADEGD
ncbi:hypothetical protein PR048_017480 [Dryococelus australis]|uniref:Uncharacterized protein n=1 Tax=Dryococelus australis TaxID=614101 RepID=A0ABQ9H9L3_9NEOP|nr:hypothetical protein PR048_017480 [Dryococelus australis]